MTSNDATGLNPIPFQVKVDSYLDTTVVAGRNVVGADPRNRTTGPKPSAKDEKGVDLNLPLELVIHHDPEGVEFVFDIIAIGNGGK